MPFSSQPRKKADQAPQGKPEGLPCGHSNPVKTCPVCIKAASAAAAAKPAPKPPLADVNKEKAVITSLREKIANKAVTDRRFDEKAAIILSSWLNGKKKK